MLFLQKSVIFFAGSLALSSATDGWTASTITYYTPAGGKCGYDAEPYPKNRYDPKGTGKKFVAALSEGFMNKSAKCGECYEVRCTGKMRKDLQCGGCKEGKTVTVQIVDQCAGSDSNCSGPDPHFDLSLDAFEEIAHEDCGKARVEFRAVKCQEHGAVEGNLEIKVKPGSHVDWASIYATNTGGPGNVREMWVRDLNPLHEFTCKWMPMPFDESNEFRYESEKNGLGRLYGPFSLKLRNSDGEQIISHNIHPTLVTAETIFAADSQKSFPRSSLINIGANFGNGDVTVGTDPCTDQALANVKLNIKPGSHAWWMAVYVTNTRNSGKVTNLYIRDEDKRQAKTCKWIKLQAKGGNPNEFVFGSGGGNGRLFGPFSVKIESDAGELTSYGVIDALTGDNFKAESHKQLIDFGTNFGSSAAVGKDQCNPDAEKPVVKKPVVEKPVVKKPVVEKPVVKKPVVEKPAVKKPVVEKPVVKKPVAEKPKGPVAKLWDQCGGQGFNGPTDCESPSCCIENSKWYSQCRPNYECKRRRLMVGQGLVN